MNRWQFYFLWVLTTLLLAGGTSWLVTHLDHGHADHGKGTERDFHQWIHDNLEITEEQHSVLEPFEKAYELDRTRLHMEVTDAGRELADAVRGGQRNSPEINMALSRLNTAQASLQRATLDHFFSMKEHLDPDQAEKLLQWTHDSIVPE